VKTRRFGNPVYVGDPINTTRIFSDCEADELLFLDIRASLERRAPPFDVIAQVAAECFVPLTFGGGITSPDEAGKILSLGVEKIALNTAAVADPTLLAACAERYGTQAVVASIDVARRGGRPPEVFVRGGRTPAGLHPVEAAIRAEQHGAGEILITSIDRDGTMDGYDMALVKVVTQAVGIPVVACGGAGTLEDVRAVVVGAGASAAAVGSLFVFHGPHRAVLISYPDRRQATAIFS
jgi:cyclase